MLGRGITAAAALLLTAGAAYAESFSCRSLGGPEPVLTFTLAQSGETFSVPDATLKLGDVSYATAATDPALQATIVDLDLDNKVEFTVRHADTDLAFVNLVTRFESGGGIATGTIRAMAGGIQVLRCDITR
jgi:hypothetical protein